MCIPLVRFGTGLQNVAPAKAGTHRSSPRRKPGSMLNIRSCRLNMGPGVRRDDELQALFHLRERELGAAAGCACSRSGPALHHRLVARIKAHAFGAVGVMVAEQALFPAA